jgi:hypothetical protein
MISNEEYNLLTKNIWSEIDMGKYMDYEKDIAFGLIAKGLLKNCDVPGCNNNCLYRRILTNCGHRAVEKYKKKCVLK